MRRFKLATFLATLMLALTALGLQAATLASFTITTSTDGNGKITPVSPIKVAQGKTAKLTVAPNKTFYVDTVTVDGTAKDLSVVDRNKPYKLAIANVQEDHTVNATFHACPKIIPTISSGSGLITPKSELFVGFNKSAKVTIKPNKGQFIYAITINGEEKSLDGIDRTKPFSLALSNVIVNQNVVVAFKEIPAGVKSFPTTISKGVYSAKYSLNQTKPSATTKADVVMTAINFNDFSKLNLFYGGMLDAFAANNIAAGICTTTCGKPLEATFTCKSACKDTTTAASFLFTFTKTGEVGTGNLSGMVYKVDANGGNSPLGGATISVDGVPVATSASDGSYSAQNIFGTAASVVKAELTGYTPAVSTGINVVAGANLYLFLQTVDPKSTLLQSGTKPSPKKISNSTGDTELTITDMQLGKDIKVVLTQLKGGAKSLPDTKKLIGNSAVEYNMTVLGGASVNKLNASDGKQIDNDDETDGFTGTVKPLTSKIEGPYAPEKLLYFTGADPNTDLTEAAALKLMYSINLYYYDKKEWKKAGPAEIVKTASGGYLLQPSGSVSLNKLKDFAFVLQEPVSITAHIQGKVTDSVTGDPLKGALVSVSDASDVTQPSGQYQLKITVPFKSPSVEIFAKLTDYDAFTGNVEIVYNPADNVITINKDIALVAIPKNSTITGKVFNVDTSAGISGADVKLATGTVLNPENVKVDGTVVTVGLDSAATYTWQFSANETTWTTLLQEQGANSLDLANYLQQIANANILSGVVKLKVTVDHPKFSEKTTGSFYVTLDFSGTGSISGIGGLVNVWGGKDKGFYFATVPGADANTTTTYKWESFVKWCANPSDAATCQDIVAPTTLSTSNILVFSQVMGFINKNIATLSATIPNSNPPTSYIADGATVFVQLSATYTLNGSTTTESSQNPAMFDIIGTGVKVGELFVSGSSDVGVVFNTVTDSVGNYLYKNIPPELSGTLVLSAKAETYLPSAAVDAGEFVAGSVVSKNIPLKKAATASNVANNMDVCDGWTIEGSSNVVKWQCITSPATYVVPADLVNVMYYPEEGLADNNAEVNNPAAVVSLLPPAEGAGYAWFGDAQTATFTDQMSNTSTTAFNGDLTSPLFDLANFTYATLNFQTWFEVESVDIESGAFDQMDLLFRIEPQVQGVPGPVQLVKPDGSAITVDEGVWYTFGTLNPSAEPPSSSQLADHNYSSGGISAVPVWLTSQFNLNPLVGRKIQVRFSFRTNDSLYNAFRGWGVDDVKILNTDSGLGFNVDTMLFAAAKAPKKR
jgi:hypothetical protein